MIAVEECGSLWPLAISAGIIVGCVLLSCLVAWWGEPPGSRGGLP